MWFLKANDQLWEKGIMLVEGPHAHTEIQFSDGKFFSSTTELGPRFCDRKDLYDPDDKEWDIIEIPCTSDDERFVRSLAEMICKGLTGKAPGYGFNHIALDFLPIPISLSSPDKWICSESCVYVLQAIGLFMGWIPQQTSPHDAFKILTSELQNWLKLRIETCA
jgi:hypothetical protein